MSGDAQLHAQACAARIDAEYSAPGTGQPRGVYVVVFTSTPRPGRDDDELRRLDEAAHAEAIHSGGLLRYVRGSYDGATCSVCVWVNQADARRANMLPRHREAASRATEFYTTFGIETYGGAA